MKYAEQVHQPVEHVVGALLAYKIGENMPSKCTKCGKLYEEGSDAIFKGCECGNKLFFYYKKITDDEAEKLKKEGASEIEREVEEILGVKKEEKDEGESNIWNIKVEEGVFKIDVASLMQGRPIIATGEEGRYLISLASAFKKVRRK